jgi:hypothetical protein
LASTRSANCWPRGFGRISKKEFSIGDERIDELARHLR